MSWNFDQSFPLMLLRFTTAVPAISVSSAPAQGCYHVQQLNKVLPEDRNSFINPNKGYWKVTALQLKICCHFQLNADLI